MFPRTVESFNVEFSTVSYYYFLKIKKIKIPKCIWINIQIKNSLIDSEITFDHNDNFINVSWDYDFDSYVVMNKEQKIRFQYEFIHYILLELFKNYELDISILITISSEIKMNNDRLIVGSKRKRLAKRFWFNIIFEFDIDSFSFFANIVEGTDVNTIPIIKTKPTYLSIIGLFSGMKAVGSIVFLGNQTDRIFEVDLENKTVKTLENAKHLVNGWEL